MLLHFGNLHGSTTVNIAPHQFIDTLAQGMSIKHGRDRTLYRILDSSMHVHGDRLGEGVDIFFVIPQHRITESTMLGLASIYWYNFE
jgi:hypothetical protein